MVVVFISSFSVDPYLRYHRGRATLSQVSASKLLNRNEHLVGVLKDAARRCHEQSSLAASIPWFAVSVALLSV